MTSPLPSRGLPEERRFVVVLVAEIQGVNDFAGPEHEEVDRQLVKGLWLRVNQLLAEHGGYGFNQIGSVVMAVWGAPLATENDAQKAVQASLALQKALPGYSNLFQMGSGPGAPAIQVRTGIDAGMVIAGNLGVQSQYTVIGDVVNNASYFMQSATAGQTLVGEAAMHLLAQRMDLRAALITGLRTKAYSIESPPAGRESYLGLEGLETRMVGRETEMQRLEAFVQRGGLPNMLLVTGEAGIGKSRLLMEFLRQLETSVEQVNILYARGLAQASDVSFYIWRKAWMAFFGMREKDSPELLRKQLIQEVQNNWGGRLGATAGLEIAMHLAQLMGIEWSENASAVTAESANPVRERIFQVVRGLLGSMGEAKKTLLVVDDLHFADPASLALLWELVKPARTDSVLALPLHIIAAARTDFLKQNPRWQNAAVVIELEALPEQADLVAMAYPALRGLSQEVLQAIAELTDGNPYFMEELAKSLVNDGKRLKNVDAPQMLAYIKENVPESLKGIIQARLDSLSHEARAVALLGSVVGRVFWVGAVIEAALAAEAPAQQAAYDEARPVVERLVQAGLRQLVRAELAFPRARTSYSLGQEYIFKHTLLREVAYSLIPDRLLPVYHHAAAEWLASQETADLRAMAAEHYEHAGEHEKAARQHEVCAELAILLGDSEEAAAHISKANKLRSLPADQN